MATYIPLTLSANVPSLRARAVTSFSVGIVTMIPVLFPTLNSDVSFLKGFYRCTILKKCSS